MARVSASEAAIVRSAFATLPQKMQCRLVPATTLCAGFRIVVSCPTARTSPRPLFSSKSSGPTADNIPGCQTWFPKGGLTLSRRAFFSDRRNINVPWFSTIQGLDALIPLFSGTTSQTFFRYILSSFQDRVPPSTGASFSFAHRPILALGSSKCALTGFFWLLSHVI